MAECHRGAEGRAPMARPRQQSPWTGCAPCSSCAEAQPHVTPGRGLRGDKGVRSPRRGQRLVRGGQRHAVPIARSQQEGGRHLRLSGSELRLHCRGPCVASTPAHQAGRRKDRRAHEAPIEWGGREENVPPQATAQPRGTGGREARQPTTHAPTLTCAAVRRDGPLRLRAAPAGAPRQGLRAGLHEVHDVHPADLGETAHKAGVCGIREKALVACEGAFLKIFQLAALLKF